MFIAKNIKRIPFTGIISIALACALTLGFADPVSAEPQGESTDITSAQSDADGVDTLRASAAMFMNNGVTYDSLQAAFDAAVSGDVITVGEGDYDLSADAQLSGGKSITLHISGDTTWKRTSYSTNPHIRIRDNSSLTIATEGIGKLTIVAGSTSATITSLIRVEEGSSLVLRGALVFSGHHASTYWGGVIHNRGTTSIDGVTFDDDRAAQGGVAYNAPSGTLTITNSSASNTYASYYGGFLKNEGTACLDTVDITQSSSRAGGGVVYTTHDITLKNLALAGEIRDNHGSYWLYSTGGHVTLGGTNTLGSNSLFFTTATPFRAEEDLIIDAEHPLTMKLSTTEEGHAVGTFPTREAAQRALPYVRAEGTALTVSADSAEIVIAPHTVQVLLDGLSNPYADDMGYTLRDIFATDEARAQARADLESYYGDSDTDEKTRAFAQLDAINKTAVYLSKHSGELAETELELNTLGSSGTDKNRTKQGYTFDNRDLTGLFIRTNPEGLVTSGADDGTATLDVFVSSGAKNVVLAWRQIGDFDTTRYTSATMNTRSLTTGFNRVTINVKDKTRPYALYVRNNSTTPATVRIASDDFYDSVAEESAPLSQIPSAAPLILGTQLGVYPTYIHDDSHPEKAWDAIQFLRTYDAERLADTTNNTYANMFDARFGGQDISASAHLSAQAYAQITTPDDATAITHQAYAAITDMLSFFQTYEGYNPNDSNAAQQPTEFHVVTLFDNTITQPSSMYAFTDYYHLSGSSLANYLTGTDLYTWGANHEYGHMLDNSVVSIPEMTNNLYSMRGATEGYRQKLREGTQQPTASVSATYHAQINQRQKDIDAWLNARIAQPDADPSDYSGSWKKGNVFQHTLSLYTLFRYFDTYDYSQYDYANSPYTEDLAHDVATYGAYGTGLRLLRDQSSVITALTNKKEERLVALSAYATGFNTVPYFEARGFTDLSDAVKQFAAQYPDPPVKLEYLEARQDLMSADNEITKTRQLFDEHTTAYVKNEGGVDPEQPISGSITLTLSTNTNADAVSLYEVYRKGTLIGFTRSASYTDTNAEGSTLADYSIIAYDWRLHPSSTGKTENTGSTSTSPEPSDEAEPSEEPAPSVDPTIPLRTDDTSSSTTASVPPSGHDNTSGINTNTGSMGSSGSSNVSAGIIVAAFAFLALVAAALGNIAHIFPFMK